MERHRQTVLLTRTRYCYDTPEGGNTMGNSAESGFAPWRECEGYVFRRHMLSHINASGGNLVAKISDSKSPVSCKDALDWIYDLLSAMDAKASALMRLNGVMLAAAAFLLNMYSAATSHAALQINKYDEIAIVVTATLSAISILLCLFVVNVSWYFLGKVTEANGELNYTEEFRELQTTAKRRQKFYRVAWHISSWAAVLFVLEFARQSFHVIFG